MEIKRLIKIRHVAGMDPQLEGFFDPLSCSKTVISTTIFYVSLTTGRENHIYREEVYISYENFLIKPLQRRDCPVMVFPPFIST